MNQFDIEAFVDRQKVGAKQLTVLLVCGLVCFMDGFDIFMIGKIAPAIAEGFGEPPEAMAFLFVCQQIGLALGAFIVSPLADRFGRRRMLMLACASFGAITLLSVYAETLFQLSIMRAIAGLFMAAGLPMALSLIAETTPARRRSTFIALALAGYSSGSAASGAVAAWLIDIYGWQSGFWIGGIVPILCIPLLALFVPESLKFRAERNPNDPTIAKTLRRMDPDVALNGDEVFVLGSGNKKGQKARLSDIFTEGRGLMTAILWAACLLSMTNIALLGAWLPTFFQEMANIPIQRFAISAMIAYLGGVTGTLTIGYLMDRFTATNLIPLVYIGLAATMIALAYIPFESPIFIVVMIGWSFLLTGGQAGLNTFITQIYPPRMRSTALGWAGGAGRIGGVLAPLYGGMAIDQSFTLQLTLGLAALVPLAVAALVFLLGRTKYEMAT
ncbi:MFS transporter [Altererythrobacter indicus]|uniref:MFS transporter n=1 Tax=Altericroceibacterium indicum TaxID=374177 RepID=A0A845A7D7_9SPHN|nr:MFS transporter [Altericroceibacterium indicum]MXP24961.1 MFS transporter [Altericroceibacterium indicum]